MRLTDQVREEQARGVMTLLKTPTSQLAVNGGSQHPDKRKAGGHGPTLADEIEHRLLPTPRASDGLAGPDPLHRPENMDDVATAVKRHLSPAVAPVSVLFPTPTTQDGANDGGPSQFERNTPPLNTMVKMLPTPMAGDAKMTRNATANRTSVPPTGIHAGETLTDVFVPQVDGELLPTPKGSDGDKGGPNQRGSSGDYALPAITNILATGKLFEHKTEPETQLLPTPSAGVFNDGEDPDQWEARQQALRDAGGDSFGMPLSVAAAKMDPDAPSIAWGDFEPAVRRWEAVLGRPAPAPTEPTGKNGAHRLSPSFVEWMMGLNAGHVTSVPGLKRNAQLKALGNGVCPQQGMAAIAHLLGQQHLFALVDARSELLAV